MNYWKEKFKWKFRKQSNRLQWHDYTQSGAYFITICTKDRKNCFWDIIDGEMKLNEYGKMVFLIWKEIDIQYRFVELWQFVIMPNHFHAIIKIIQYQTNSCRDAIYRVWEERIWEERVWEEKPLHYRDAINRISTNNEQGWKTWGKNPMIIQSLWKIVRFFKAKCAYEIRKKIVWNHFYFWWQTNYYEHLIRNEKEFLKINQYIIDNPKKWEFDSNNI